MARVRAFAVVYGFLCTGMLSWADGTRLPGMETMLRSSSAVGKSSDQQSQRILRLAPIVDAGSLDLNFNRNQSGLMSNIAGTPRTGVSAGHESTNQVLTREASHAVPSNQPSVLEQLITGVPAWRAGVDQFPIMVQLAPVVNEISVWPVSLSNSSRMPLGAGVATDASALRDEKTVPTASHPNAPTVVARTVSDQKQPNSPSTAASDGRAIQDGKTVEFATTEDGAHVVRASTVVPIEVLIGAAPMINRPGQDEGLKKSATALQNNAATTLANHTQNAGNQRTPPQLTDFPEEETIPIAPGADEEFIDPEEIVADPGSSTLWGDVFKRLRHMLQNWVDLQCRRDVSDTL